MDTLVNCNYVHQVLHCLRLCPEKIDRHDQNSLHGWDLPPPHLVRNENECLYSISGDAPRETATERLRQARGRGRAAAAAGDDSGGHGGTAAAAGRREGDGKGGRRRRRRAEEGDQRCGIFTSLSFSFGLVDRICPTPTRSCTKRPRSKFGSNKKLVWMGGTIFN